MELPTKKEWREKYFREGAKMPKYRSGVSKYPSRVKGVEWHLRRLARTREACFGTDYLKSFGGYSCFTWVEPNGACKFSFGCETGHSRKFFDHVGRAKRWVDRNWGKYARLTEHLEEEAYSLLRQYYAKEKPEWCIEIKEVHSYA